MTHQDTIKRSLYARITIYINMPRTKTHLGPALQFTDRFGIAYL